MQSPPPMGAVEEEMTSKRERSLFEFSTVHRLPARHLEKMINAVESLENESLLNFALLAHSTTTAHIRRGLDLPPSPPTGAIAAHSVHVIGLADEFKAHSEESTLTFESGAVRPPIPELPNPPL